MKKNFSFVAHESRHNVIIFLVDSRDRGFFSFLSEKRNLPRPGVCPAKIDTRMGSALRAIKTYSTLRRLISISLLGLAEESRHVLRCDGVNGCDNGVCTCYARPSARRYHDLPHTAEAAVRTESVDLPETYHGAIRRSLERRYPHSEDLEYSFSPPRTRCYAKPPHARPRVQGEKISLFSLHLRSRLDLTVIYNF